MKAIIGTVNGNGVCGIGLQLDCIRACLLGSVNDADGTVIILQVIAGQQIQDLSVAEPDLEEIFMHYYR